VIWCVVNGAEPIEPHPSPWAFYVRFLPEVSTSFSVQDISGRREKKKPPSIQSLGNWMGGCTTRPSAPVPMRCELTPAFQPRVRNDRAPWGGSCNASEVRCNRHPWEWRLSLEDPALPFPVTHRSWGLKSRGTGYRGVGSSASGHRSESNLSHQPFSSAFHFKEFAAHSPEASWFSKSDQHQMTKKSVIPGPTIRMETFDHRSKSIGTVIPKKKKLSRLNL
jgi:hypothetical protein